MRLRGLVGGTVALTIAFVGEAARGAGPDAAQVLALKPVQAEAVVDAPEGPAVEQCKLEVVKTAEVSGWVLRDGRGLVVRKFLDTNRDNVVDQWSFFLNGSETYRDIDTNFNGKADQCRWFHSGGSRWGIDANEDGRIDRWKTITAEEASAEAVAAIVERNPGRLKAVMVSDEDVRALGLNEQATQRVQKRSTEAGPEFEKLCGSVPETMKFVRFDGHQPLAAPGADVGAQNDVLVYDDATIVAEVDGKTVMFRVAEIVKVGDVWKLTETPSIVQTGQPLAATGVLIPAPEQTVVSTATGAGEESMVESDEEVQKLVGDLQQHDKTMANGGANERELVAYHERRAELCASIGAKSKKAKNREYWYKQTADSLNAAVQTGQYPRGIELLDQYSAQFAKMNWGKSLAAYFKYRSLNSAYAIELSNAKADHAKAQEAFLGRLQEFLKEHPDADDAPDALWQLGNGMEFAGKDEEAKKFYQQLVAQFPKNSFADKAAGANRRLDANGQPFQLVGGSLAGANKIDTARFRGKVLVVSYWSTWCEPCKAEMPKLDALAKKYGDRGLEVIGVCLDSNKTEAEAFIRQKGYKWPQIYEEGSLDSAPAVRYGIISLPYMMLVDEEGRVLNQNLQAGEVEAEVEKALSKRVASKNE